MLTCSLLILALASGLAFLTSAQTAQQGFEDRSRARRRGCKPELRALADGGKKVPRSDRAARKAAKAWTFGACGKGGIDRELSQSGDERRGRARNSGFAQSSWRYAAGRD